MRRSERRAGRTRGRRAVVARKRQRRRRWRSKHLESRLDCCDCAGGGRGSGDCRRVPLRQLCVECRVGSGHVARALAAGRAGQNRRMHHWRSRRGVESRWWRMHGCAGCCRSRQCHRRHDRGGGRSRRRGDERVVRGRRLRRRIPDGARSGGRRRGQRWRSLIRCGLGSSSSRRRCGRRGHESAQSDTRRGASGGHAGRHVGRAAGGWVRCRCDCCRRLLCIRARRCGCIVTHADWAQRRGRAAVCEERRSAAQRQRKAQWSGGGQW